MIAADFVRAVHQRLVADYPAIPDAIALMDESAHDYGIAHFLGIDREMFVREGFAYYGQTLDGIAVLTFDAGRVPAEWVVAHELGHAMHENCGGTPNSLSANDSVLIAYWRAMGYTTPLAEAVAFIEAQNDYFATHKWNPVEHFADAFAFVTANAFGSADFYRWGGGITAAKREELRAFFASLRSVQTEEDEMTPEEFERRWLEMYRKVQVSDTFDALKKVDADLATDLRLHTHETTTAKLA